MFRAASAIANKGAQHEPDSEARCRSSEASPTQRAHSARILRSWKLPTLGAAITGCPQLERVRQGSERRMRRP
eukprot:14958116-Alexandrium_andersonii.AAC.1